LDFGMPERKSGILIFIMDLQRSVSQKGAKDNFFGAIRQRHIIIHNEIKLLRLLSRNQLHSLYGVHHNYKLWNFPRDCPDKVVVPMNRSFPDTAGCSPPHHCGGGHHLPLVRPRRTTVRIYLILFATHALVPQRQNRPSKLPSHLVFLLILTDLTPTPTIPFASSGL